MERTTWPERDQGWVARYRRGVAGKNVPADVLGERERELLEAVQEAEVPAAELFGDAYALARDDVAELATVDEAVRTSEGGGLRPALREVGGTLVGVGVVAVLLMLVRRGWTVDIDVACVLVAVSVVALMLGWVAGRALASAGRPGTVIGLLVAVGSVALGGITAAASLGPDHVAARDVPVPLLALGLLAPGVVALVTAHRMPEQELRESWDDAEWLRRFAGGLRTRLVPSATARDHVAEIEQAVDAAAVSAYAEFGHPLVLARRLADADRTSRARRWWVSAVAGTGTPLVVAALVLAMDTWGPLTIPVVVVLVVGALVSLSVRWDDRPRARRR